ncbi:MAG: glycosyltransferase family 4 protein [Ignisphaera sp.]
MRIIIFSELFYPHGGGAELATWLYSKLLAEKGFKVTVVTRQFPGEASVEILNSNIKIIRVPMKIALRSRYDTLANAGVLAGASIRRQIKESDIVYIPCGWYSVIPLAKIYGKPVVVHMHNYSIICPTSLMYDFVKQKSGSTSSTSFILHEIIEKRRRLAHVVASSLANEILGKYYNRICLMADALVFVSNAQRELVLSRIPYIARKSYVINNPIPDIPLIKAEEKGLGYFGGMSFVKGFHVLMQALKSKRYPMNIKVYITKALREQKMIKIDNKVSINFMSEIKPIGKIMNKITVVVIPSICPEPLPYTLIESMLYGKLVIASNVGGIPEITNGVKGVKLVKPGDVSEFAEAITSFLTFDIEEANAIGMSLREHVLQKFDNNKIIKSFINILDRVNR